MIKLVGGVLLFVVSLFNTAYADELFYGISEEVGDMTSSTSSKRDEELFVTPLSISIVTEKQIRQSGITSIAEALKLVPGVIVREQTNGQFDVHIRGFENIISGAALTNLNNRKTLIMIDNRIVFDYFSGGIFWDTLPISLDDVDRIEVVRGAVSSLYGANAVTGVIHIFTKKGQGNGSIKTSLMAGTKNSQVVQLSAEKIFTDIAVRFSAGSESRDRYESKYFSILERQYKAVDDIELQSTAAIQNHGERAVDKQSFRLTLNNNPLEYFNYDLSLFHQESDVQKVHMNSRDIPFSDNLSNTDGFNLKLNYGNLNSRISHHFGKQETIGFPDFTYDTAISQVSIFYQLKFPKWLIQPGIDSNRTTYDGGFIGGVRTTHETNYMLRAEYNPKREWRFISAFSYSDFNAPKENYLNYQLLTTYQLSFDTSLRASIQAASSSSFMVNQYIDIEFTFPNDPSQRVDVKGDKNGRLSRMNTYEVGVRKQLDFNSFIDIEVFHSEINNFTNFIIQPPIMIEGQSVTKRELTNLPLRGQQDGLTFNWIYEGATWNINTFFTWQNTEVFDQAESLIQGAETFDKYNDSTPKYYGGVNMNWQFNESLNFNVLSNYLHSHSFELQEPQGTKETPSAMYTNLTLSYRHSTTIEGFIAVKNLSDQRESQHFYTDRLEPIYWLGFNVKFGN